MWVTCVMTELLITCHLPVSWLTDMSFMCDMTDWLISFTRVMTDWLHVIYLCHDWQTTYDLPESCLTKCDLPVSWLADYIWLTVSYLTDYMWFTLCYVWLTTCDLLCVMSDWLHVIHSVSCLTDYIWFTCVMTDWLITCHLPVSWLTDYMSFTLGHNWLLVIYLCHDWQTTYHLPVSWLTECDLPVSWLADYIWFTWVMSD